METPTFESIGHCVDSSQFSALVDWRDTWARALSLDRLREDRIKQVVTTVTERPAGRVEIIVKIIPVGGLPVETFFYKIQRTGGVYTQIGGL